MKAKNRIQAVLSEKRLKQKSLVVGVGVSRPTVSNWVNNHKQPSLETLYKIAEVLEVDVCELLERGENA